MPLDFEDLIGSRLVIGFPGTEVTPEIVEQFRATRAGGVIFFRINFSSPDQIRQVITDLENRLQRRLLVCVDHEGGRVIMYGGGVTVFPDNLAFGRDGRVENVRAMARIAAKELRALGTDVNFAPVVDVLTSGYSPNIGIRSFGSDWKQVAEMGAAYIDELQKGGVSATAKHFPGSGHNTIDAHLNLPTVDLDWREMMAVHVQPFVAAIKAGVDVIMSSHPLYRKLDPANIATFSRRIMTDCLRDELGFKGVISSDDLEMGAIKETIGIGVAAVRAVAAGHDLILSCHDFAAQRDVAKALNDAYRGKFLPVAELEESVERVEALRRKRPRRFEGNVGPRPEGALLALDVARHALETIQDPKRLLPLAGNVLGRAAVVFPRLSDLAQRIMIEPALADEKRFIRERWSEPPPDVALYGLDASDDEILSAASAAGKAEATIFFCYDAHLHPRQKLLLDSLRQASRRLVLVSMRDPYDREFLEKDDAGLAIFGWRACQVQVALDKIRGADV